MSATILYTFKRFGKYYTYTKTFESTKHQDRYEQLMLDKGYVIVGCIAT